MAPSRKSRSVNKRFSYINNVSPNKSGENGNKSRLRKKKLADMLGPQWKKEDLERFYKAYRKHGKDWEKVAAMVHNRSVEMVEALYTMNRAYLSLPKGYASAAGLTAMMTDHYANMEEDSNSEQETNEGIGVSRKPQKRPRGAEGGDGPSVADLLNSQLTESSYSCLSLLKKRRSESRPWAVGKRTPRVPVSHAGEKDNGEKYISPIRQSLKAKVDALDDDVAHKLALALTEASKGGRTLKVSQTPKLKAKRRSPVQNGARVRAGPVVTSSKLRGSMMDDGGCELPSGSTEADVGDYAGDRRALKGKKYLGKKPEEEEESIDNGLDEIKEACSGTEEGEKVSAVKGNFDMEIGNKKHERSSNKSTRKKSKKVLFGQGEDAAFDALQTLADLSLRLPETPVDTESSMHAEEEKAGIVAKSKVKRSHSTPGIKTTSIKTTKQISENDELTGTHLGDFQKSEGKLLKPPECTSSSSDHGRELNDSAPSTLKVISPKKLNLTTKVRSRRKLSMPEPLMAKDIKSVDSVGNAHFHDRVLSLKEKLSNCFSCYQVRRWCIFEWFYSAIDYPWFAKKEFVEYLDHVGLGHISRLTRIEWGVIRSSLGKPRRFSEQFVKEERGKLNQYRDSVREHYAELRAGTRDGLPTDLARPLYVGQQVIALHPKTREIHDGSVLTIDHSRTRVQFGQSELGVEFIMDVDCMPLNTLDNMPASLIKHTPTSTKIIDDCNELKMNDQPMERKVDGYAKFASSENLENIDTLLHIAPSTNHISNSLQQAKVSSFEI
uniref:Protein ALWAYS EARLY 3 isoform X2 n=1 Tax=Rhizophora mucronata TaxID=61149 RepID=A0A2P2KWT2_RHIMU